MWPSYNETLNPEQSLKTIDRNISKDISLTGKTKKGHSYIIKAKNGKQIDEKHFVFQGITCTFLGKEISTFSAEVGHLDLMKKQMILEGNLLVSPTPHMSFQTQEGCLDYALEKIWGNTEVKGTWIHKGYLTSLSASGFESDSSYTRFKGKVFIQSQKASVL